MRLSDFQSIVSEFRTLIFLAEGWIAEGRDASCSEIMPTCNATRIRLAVTVKTLSEPMVKAKYARATARLEKGFGRKSRRTSSLLVLLGVRHPRLVF